MKIPESVRISGVEYKVVLVPNLMCGSTAAYGHIDYDRTVIELSDTFGTEHQKRCQILLHEILHGIREANGMEIANEEEVVDMFAKGIYQVLQDNGARFFDIDGKIEKTKEKNEVARVIFEEIKRSKVTLGHPAKIICFRATPTGEVEETVEGWVVPQSRIEELEKKYIGGKTDEDISD